MPKKYVKNEEINNKKVKKVTKNNPKKVKNNKRKGLRVALIVLLIILIIALAVVGGAYWYMHSKLGKMQQVEVNVEEFEAAENLTGYRNIALFGVDSRADDFGKGNRSDTIVIVSINQETKDVRLISVYRDTYMQIEGYGLDKITHAYSYGEAPLAIKTLNKNLDLNITEFVTVNFGVVADAINAIGGVDIDVDSAELKYINEYVNGTSRDTGIKSVHVTKTGMQTLDGVQAVAYARIRYTEGGDYKRAERAREVMEAALTKVKTMNVAQLNSLLDIVLPELYTNIPAKSIIAMIPDVLKYNITESVGWPYDTKGATINGVWYGPPVTLESNVVKLHAELFPDEEDYVVSDYVKEISNKIIRKTGYRSM